MNFKCLFCQVLQSCQIVSMIRNIVYFSYYIIFCVCWSIYNEGSIFSYHTLYVYLGLETSLSRNNFCCVSVSLLSGKRIIKSTTMIALDNVFLMEQLDFIFVGLHYSLQTLKRSTYIVLLSQFFILDEKLDKSDINIFTVLQFKLSI